MCRATDKNTNKEKYIIEKYNNAKHFTIWQAYKKPSEQKRALYHYYISECYRLGGSNFKIFSYNAFYVSFAYKLNNRLVLITPTRRMEILCETN